MANLPVTPGTGAFLKADDLGGGVFLVHHIVDGMPAVTNAGTFAVQIDPTAVAALTLLDDAVTALNAVVGSLKAILVAGSDGVNARAIKTTTAGAVVVDDGGGSISIDDGGAALTVDGTVGISGTVPVSGPLTDAQLRASGVPVTGPLTDTQLRASPPAVSISGTPAVSISGTPSVSISGTPAVTGPLTDAQMRATPVPVSGPLTDTQLRASPPAVSVSGTAAVSGPVTDTQLRASPVPVSGPLTDTQLRASAVIVTGPLTDGQLRATPVPVSGPLTDTLLRASPVPVTSRQGLFLSPSSMGTQSTTPQYVIGDAIGDTVLSIANAVPASGGSGTVLAVAVTCKSTQTSGAMDVLFFNANPTASVPVDNALYDIADADWPKYIQAAHCNDIVPVNTGAAWQSTVPIPFKLASGTTLFAVIVARSSTTLLSTADIGLNVVIMPDG